MMARIFWFSYFTAWMLAVLWLSHLEHSRSVAQQPVDPDPDAWCIRLEGGPLRCSIEMEDG